MNDRNLTQDMTLAEWDARFLSAKVSYCLETARSGMAEIQR